MIQTFPTHARWSWYIKSKLCPTLKNATTHLQIDPQKQTITLTCVEIAEGGYAEALARYFDQCFSSELTGNLGEEFEVIDLDKDNTQNSLTILSKIYLKDFNQSIDKHYRGKVTTNISFYFKSCKLLYSHDSKNHWASCFSPEFMVVDELKKLLKELESIPTPS